VCMILMLLGFVLSKNVCVVIGNVVYQKNVFYRLSRVMFM